MNHRTVVHFMSTGIAILGIVLCVPAAMQAQNTTPPPDSQGMPARQGGMPMRRGGPPSPKEQLQRLTTMLNLTPDQQKQMLPILRDQRKQMAAIRSDSSLDPQTRRQKMRDSMMDTHQKLEAIMTDSQKQQFEQQMQRRRRGMGMRGQGMGPGPGAGAPPPPPSGDQAPPPPPQQ